MGVRIVQKISGVLEDQLAYAQIVRKTQLLLKEQGQVKTLVKLRGSAQKVRRDNGSLCLLRAQHDK